MIFSPIANTIILLKPERIRERKRETERETERQRSREREWGGGGGGGGAGGKKLAKSEAYIESHVHQKDLIFRKASLLALKKRR